MNPLLNDNLNSLLRTFPNERKPNETFSHNVLHGPVKLPLDMQGEGVLDAPSL